MPENLDKTIKRIAGIARRLASDNPTEIATATSALSRALAKSGRDIILIIAERIESDPQRALSDDDKEALFEAGRQEGLRAGEAKGMAASQRDFADTSETAWRRMLETCCEAALQYPNLFRGSSLDFLDSLPHRSGELSERQMAWLVDLYRTAKRRLKR